VDTAADVMLSCECEMPVREGEASRYSNIAPERTTGGLTQAATVFLRDFSFIRM
jgi:hypothetical protein